MHFTKIIFIFAIMLALYLGGSEAGNQASKVAKEAGKQAGKAAKKAGDKAPPVLIVGYSANSTYDGKFDLGSKSPPSSPKKG